SASSASLGQPGEGASTGNDATADGTGILSESTKSDGGSTLSVIECWTSSRTSSVATVLFWVMWLILPLLNGSHPFNLVSPYHRVSIPKIGTDRYISPVPTGQ